MEWRILKNQNTRANGRVISACLLLLFIMALPAMTSCKYQQAGAANPTDPNAALYTDEQDLHGQLPDNTGIYINPQKRLYNEDVPYFTENEFKGIVSKGLLVKDMYNDTGFGWHLGLICRELGAEMTVLESIQGLPVDFNVTYQGIHLNFKAKLEKLEEIYLINLYMAMFTYKVFKDGAEVPMEQPPLCYKSGGPYVDMEEFLGVLGVPFYVDGDITYLNSDRKTHISGKKLFDSKVVLGCGKEVYFKLVYHYRGEMDPRYQSVEFTMDDGSVEETVELFSTGHPWSAEFYDSGSIEEYFYHGEQLVAVNFARDIIVFRYEKDQLIPIFDTKDYRQYGEGCFQLETGTDGMCRFIDQVHEIARDFILPEMEEDIIVSLKGGSFRRMYWKSDQDRLGLEFDLRAIKEGKRIFEALMEFVYDGNTFIPNRVYAQNHKKFDLDKMAGKEIRSMNEYMLFDYKLQE